MFASYLDLDLDPRHGFIQCYLQVLVWKKEERNEDLDPEFIAQLFDWNVLFCGVPGFVPSFSTEIDFLSLFVYLPLNIIEVIVHL